MKRRSLLNIFLFLTAVLMGGMATAQDKPKSVKKQRKEFIELQESRAEGADKAKEKDMEKHMKIQTKETQKRMKKNRKKSERLQRNKHEKNFFERLFTKKPKRS